MDVEMMRKQRQYFGWYDSAANVYWLSKLPPDAPVRKAFAYRDLSELEAEVERRHGWIYWDPLPPGMMPADNNLTPIVAERTDPDKARAQAADLQRRRQDAHSEPPGDDIWRGWPLP